MRGAGAATLQRLLRRVYAAPQFGEGLALLAAELARAGATPRAADIVEAALCLRRSEDRIAQAGSPA
jgi:hypothetical protein